MASTDARAERTPEQLAAAKAATSERRYRWRIVALLFFATTLNYLDRQVIGILAPDLQRIFAWSDIEYATIVSSFKIAYGIGLVTMGGLLDRIGTRKGFAIGLTGWSIASALHALAGSVLGFAVARFALGFAEACNFPAAVKTVAEWFPKKERAFATGLFNSGANIGAIVAPLLVPIIAVKMGWRWAFIITGALGAIWLVVWLRTYYRPAEHPRLTADELAFIQSDGIEPTTRIPFRRVLPHRETITLCALKFVTDPVWWFFLFWLPKWLHDRMGLSLLEIGAPLVVIYLVSDAGSIAGGWLSSWYVKRGHSVDYARKRTMFISALFALPIFWASQTPNLWTAVALISLGTAAHQAFSTNIFTVMSDIFPQRAVASVVGVAGLSGAIGGAIIAEMVGFLLVRTNSYVVVFGMFSFAYLVAWAVLKVGIPEIRPLNLDTAGGGR